MTKPKGPVLIELDTPAEITPATAPPVPEPELHEPRAMQAAISLTTHQSSWLGKIFWGALITFLGFIVSLTAWEFVTGLTQRSPILGSIALGLLGLMLLVLLLVTLRELAALSRLARVDSIHRAAETALAADDLTGAKDVTQRLTQLYKNRRELDLAREKLTNRLSDIFDADGVFDLAETELLTSLDEAAHREVEAAARSVATVTALVPLAFADVIVALTQNLRMIRRIAEIYGGRAGMLGGWRLTRTVMTHLVATGAVAVGDDMIGSLAGGGALAKLSRRFGEGLINGALTARVGIAAMEVCRPLPFRARSRPRVTTLLKRAFTGLFSKND